MKDTPPGEKTAERSRLSLEQKILLLVRRYREAERRRKRKEACRSKYRRRLGVLPSALRRPDNADSARRRM